MGGGRLIFACRESSDHGCRSLEYVELVLPDVEVLFIEERSDERDVGGGGGGARRLVLGYPVAGEDEVEEIGGRSR